jgi:hypothetical protein
MQSISFERTGDAWSRRTRRWAGRLVIGLALTGPLTGCISQVSESAPLDSTNSAELDFVKGHEAAGLGHAGGEYFTVCVTPACTERRFFVSLTFINPDTVVRRVHAGEVIVAANTMNVSGRTEAVCKFAVTFNVDAGHAYAVEIFNRFGAQACYFRVQDKATGAPVHVSSISAEDGDKPPGAS